MAANTHRSLICFQMRDIAFDTQTTHLEELKQNDTSFNRTGVMMSNNHGLETGGRSLVAWGGGPTFELIRTHAPEMEFSCLVDRNAVNFPALHHGVPVVSPEALTAEFISDSYFVITAHSANAIRSIFDELSRLNLRFRQDFADYSWFSLERISGLASSHGIKMASFPEIHAAVLLGRVDMETTIQGNWILDSLLRNSYLSPEHCIAEVGAFRCGNAMLQNWRMRSRGDFREYHVFDSFEGFDDLEIWDPSHLAGVYSPEMYDFNLTRNLAELSPSMKIHKGFVPDVFNDMSAEAVYDVVFYDCDLYRPCLDSFGYFWSKIAPGGYFVVHDYVTYEGGWNGVSKALDEVVSAFALKPIIFWESTMALLKKE